MTDTLREQFEFERTSALRLKSASAAERPSLYLEIYDEFYRRYGSHGPRLSHQFLFLRRFLRGDTGTYVEIGPGPCLTLLEVAKRWPRVIGIEATSQRTMEKRFPDNVRFVISNGNRWDDLEDDCADIVYSNQLLEHLHPEDCVETAQTAHRVLKPGGLFISVTPNVATGPHDVSQHFSKKAEGLHLREYDNRSLAQAMRRAGFRSIKVYSGARGLFFPLPVGAMTALEALASLLPARLRKTAPVRGILGIRMVARK